MVEGHTGGRRVLERDGEREEGERGGRREMERSKVRGR